MRLYDCKVLLGGSRENEVRKEDISAAEIMVLRALHGQDSITDIKPKAMSKKPHADERRHLFMTYVGAEEGGLGSSQKEKGAILSGLFGPTHMPLPAELPVAEKFADLEEEAPPVRRVTLKAGKAEDVAAQLS